MVLKISIIMEKQTLFAIVLVFIQLLAMFMFAFSFFDAEQALFGSSDSSLNNPLIEDVFEANSNYFKLRSHCDNAHRKPLFSKCVLVIIDALRADFVPSIQSTHQNRFRDLRMPFTESLIKTNGIGMISVASTPTVTMPRIKSIISGTLPSFMDFILNLNAYAFKGENLVENAWKAGKKIVFYGDDTWTQLFPSHIFHRSNATSSFYATDYIQVDTNVTYNVERELNRLNDWDFMIAHYLGVDHIGHSYGGHNSKLLPQKLREMDNVIELIYQKIKDSEQSYLIVITGDHGMTDIGNHGGSTAQETDTALIFLSSKSTTSVKNKLKADRILQLDIASTLSKLIGLPLPNKSKGRLILPVLREFNMQNNEVLCHLFTNAIQIGFVDYHLSKHHFKLLYQALDAHSKFIDTGLTKNNQIQYNYVTDKYNNYINQIQSTLLTSSTKTSIFSLLTVAVIFAFIPIFGFLKIEHENIHSVIFVKVKDFQTLFTYFIIVLSIILLASTSFIEMEHYYWYYVTSTLIVLHFGKAICNYNFKPISTSYSGPFSSLFSNNKVKIFSCVLILILQRISFNWNLLYAYDIGEWLDEPENKRILSAVVICSLIAISFMMSSQRLGKQICLLMSGFVWVYLYRSYLGSVSSFRIPFFPRTDGNFRAQIVFFHVLLSIFDILIKRLKLKYNWSFLDNLLPVYSIKPEDSSISMSCVILRTLCKIWVLLSALFMNVHNIPLLAINIILEKIVDYAIHRKDNSYKATLALTYLCFAQSAFYSLGNSNTLSTIDVSPAFIGLDSYQPILAALFMVINMYSLYVFWLLMLFIRLKQSHTIIHASLKLSSIINLLLITRFTATAFYMCVSIILQNHLFIWSVLCPKFLYEASLTILNDIVMVFVVLNHIID